MKLEIRAFRDDDKQAVIKLWQNCALVVPWNDPLRDIKRKLKVQPGLLLVGCKDDKIVATVMAGYDGHRGWIYYLAVASKFRDLGLGRKMMKEAEKRLRSLGCAKINLQVRSINKKVIEFYKSLGFEFDDVVSMGKRLVNDE